MLRRTTGTLFGRTHPRLGGDIQRHMQDPKDAPHSDTVTGLLGKPLLGQYKLLRLIDPVYILHRFTSLDREGWVGSFGWYSMCWGTVFLVPLTVWNDGAPPRKLDLNQGISGHLPEGFVSTKIVKV